MKMKKKKIINFESEFLGQKRNPNLDREKVLNSVTSADAANRIFCLELCFLPSYESQRLVEDFIGSWYFLSGMLMLIWMQRLN